jgi:hypothetical protein
MNTTIIALAPLLFSPTARTPPPPPDDDFVDRLAQVEVVSGDGEAQLIAYDTAGEVIGMVAMWPGERGTYHLEVDFADGWLSTTVVDGREQTTTTLPGDVLARRAAAMSEIAPIGPDDPQEGKLGCAVQVAIAVGLCAPLALSPVVGIFTCPAGIVLAWCKCAPLLGLDGGICDEL